MTGTAVLIHGTWGRPQDWHWVAPFLEAAGVRVITPDLPTMQRPDARLADDVEVVRAAVRAARAPVVVMGWSYGGSSIAGAVAGETSVEHLVYLMTRPDWDDDVQAIEDGFLAFCRTDPHIDVDEHDATLLDTEWWLTEEDGATLRPDVRDFLAAHPRRRAAQPHIAAVPLEPVWERIPTTIVLGRHDVFESDENIADCTARVPDTRVWETDHFALFRMPEEVAAVVLEALDERP